MISSIFSQEAYAVLKNKNFRWYMSSRFALHLALQIQSLAVGWQVYELTNDPLALGFVGLAEVIPAVGTALFAGFIVDRSDRRNILSRAQFFSFLLLLYFGAIPYLAMDNGIKVGLLYLGVFLGGIARAFFASSAFAFFGQIIPRPHYVRASAWNSSVWQTASLLGPAVAGFLYAGLGSQDTYWIGAGLSLISFLSILQIPKQGKILQEVQQPLSKSLFEGVNFVVRHRLIFPALSLDLLGVLFGGAVALLPIFAKDILEVGPQGLGFLRAAPAIGAFCMVLFFASRPPRKNAGRMFIFALMAFGGCIVGFALSKSFYLSMILLAFSGALDSVSVVVRSAILQLSTPDNMRGRVSAVNSIFISSSNELGAFESGLAAKILGVIPSVLFGGSMTILIALTSLRVFPELRDLNIDQLEDGKAT